MPINRFRGQYYFLSNFYPCPHGVEFDGDVYPTSEHAYQAAKIEDRTGRESFTITGSLGQSGPMVAKMKGKHVHKRPSWDSNKVKFMAVIVKSKFTRDPKLITHLIDTGDQKIVEGHTGDKFWGGKANHLGNILMKVREEVRSPQFQLPVAEEIDVCQPARGNKGHSFEVLMTHSFELEHLYPKIMEQFGDIIDRWCHNHRVDQELYQFHVMDPAGVPQVVDRESHLFDYADIRRNVSIIARHIEEENHCIGDSLNSGSDQTVQVGQPHPGLPSRFADWLQAQLREEALDHADCMFGCVFACLADVAVDDMIEQLTAATEMLKESGYQTVADELVEQWYASLD